MLVKLVFDKNFDDFDDSEEYTYTPEEIEKEGGILKLIERFQKKYLVLSMVEYLN